MKQFSVAYFSYHDGLITQKLITETSKEHAICDMLIQQGWEITVGDCTEEGLCALADMHITAMELNVQVNDLPIMEVK